MTEAHQDDGVDEELARLYEMRAQNQQQHLLITQQRNDIEEMIAKKEGPVTEETVQRRRRMIRGLAWIPGIGGGATLIRRWPHIVSGVGGALAAGGVALALTPQIGGVPSHPDAGGPRPAIVAPSHSTAPPQRHPKTTKTPPASSKPPSAEPPVSEPPILEAPVGTPTVVPVPPLPAPGKHTKKPHPSKRIKPVRRAGKPSSSPGDQLVASPRCRISLLGVLELLCNRHGR